GSGQRLARVVLGLYRTDRRAGGVARAALPGEALHHLARGAAIRRAHRAVIAAGDGVSGRRIAADLQAHGAVAEGDLLALEPLAEALIRVARRDALHGVVVAVGERQAVVALLLDVGRDTQLALRLAVVG